MLTEKPLSSSASASRAAVCETCGGLGQVRYDVQIGDPRFGKLFPCPSCRVDAMVQSAGLTLAERSTTLADIETRNRPGAAAMLRAAREWIASGRVGTLTVHGGFGNGKSTLLRAIVNDCIAHDVEARYVSMIEVLAYAKEAFGSTEAGDSDFSRLNKLARTQVLVIDELDKARQTEYAVQLQNHLFEVRYRERDRLGTVVAWNGGFEDFDLPWVRSRLSEGVVVHNADAGMRPLLGEKS